MKPKMNSYILNYLVENGHVGASKGIKADSLLRALGYEISKSNIRSLQAEIRKLRLSWREEDGISAYILSDTENGYYLPETASEVEHFIRSQHSRAFKSFATTTHLRRYLEGLEKEGEKHE